MHAKGWTREQADGKFYIDTIGRTVKAGTITEIERYCVSPGQACSYMVGKMTWLRLRHQPPRRSSAPSSTSRAFHDAGLPLRRHAAQKCGGGDRRVHCPPEGLRPGQARGTPANLPPGWCPGEDCPPSLQALEVTVAF